MRIKRGKSMLKRTAQHLQHLNILELSWDLVTETKKIW